MKKQLPNPREPIFLASDNFTPLSRTPWAGSKITSQWKRGLVSSELGGSIGESWEFSCDPDFPTKLADGGMTLPEVITREPQEILGSLYKAQAIPSCELLVKLIDTDQPLSLQIHPDDDYARLKDSECGKPEAWLVLDVAPREDAGLYLGFSKPIEKTELRHRIISGQDVASLLEFVRVSPGDYFNIPAGVPHAIGPGLTLLEPQRVLFGKSGKTYRMWDWQRLYDANGNLDPVRGSPRDLHLDEAIELCEPKRQHGACFAASLRQTPQVSKRGNLVEKIFPENGFCQLTIVEASLEESYQVFADSYLVVVVLHGSVGFSTGKTAKKGQTVLLPAAFLSSRVVMAKDTSLAVLRPL